MPAEPPRNEGSGATDSVVYVVDDDPSVQRSVTRVIRSLGHAVKVFSNTRDFLAVFDAGRPGCLILDFQLPGQNGLELQRQLRASGVSIPIVFISGHASIPVSVDAMKAGAIDFLVKPFEPRELVRLVEGALAAEHQRLEERAVDRELEKRFHTLTTREREVFELVVAGLLNKQVGGKLGITEKTVKVHRARAVQKLGAESMADLVRVAWRLGRKA